MIDLGSGSFVHAWRDGEWIIIRTKAGGSETTVSLTAEQFEKLLQLDSTASKADPMAETVREGHRMAEIEIPEGLYRIVAARCRKDGTINLGAFIEAVREWSTAAQPTLWDRLKRHLGERW